MRAFVGDAEVKRDEVQVAIADGRRGTYPLMVASSDPVKTFSLVWVKTTWGGGGGAQTVCGRSGFRCWHRHDVVGVAVELVHMAWIRHVHFVYPSVWISRNSEKFPIRRHSQKVYGLPIKLQFRTNVRQVNFLQNLGTASCGMKGRYELPKSV